MRLGRQPAHLSVLLGLLLAAVASGLPPALGADLAPAPPATAGWGWPLPGGAPVMRGFAPPAQPWLPGNRGVDLRGRSGQVVRAAGRGVVHFAGRVGGVGVVSILHGDGLLTTYEPVRPLVRRGDRVWRGQPIGRLLRTGSHCGLLPCLHWGLRRGTAYLDPLSLVGAGRVRLLPLYPPDGPFPLPGPLSAADPPAGVSRR
jgi:murein DD-endopeptidase MepM/ murein hydrolase activator NlpD